MKLWKSIVSTFLAALLLVAGSGYSLHRMVCLHSGKTQTSLFEFKCCSDNHGEPQETTLKGKCCEKDSMNLSVDEFSSQKDETQAQLAFCTLFTWESNEFDFTTLHRILDYADSSPPFVLKNRHIRHQVFLC
ncbi:hypothetical protein KFE98_08900 [bacterium SCSIO 12741]|nr:hypothetical protein KFE98_08900 [bacterium SCSIO 12741]